MDAIRAAGPNAAQLLRRLRAGRLVPSDQIACLARLVQAHGEPAFEQACARALYLGATDGARRIERILARGLEALPLPSAARDGSRAGAADYGRPLAEYTALLGAEGAQL